MKDFEQQLLAREAKAIVALAFRNGPIEDVHAGRRCPTCEGQAGYSRITDAEMKSIMKNAVDKVFELLSLKNENPAEYGFRIKFGSLHTSTWDEPVRLPSRTLIPYNPDDAPEEEMADLLELNRSAIIVTPKQPFLDWLHSVDPTSRELKLSDLAKEPFIYLVQECENEREFEKCLRKMFPAIFASELTAWWTDISGWPVNRTLDMFRKWFDICFHSVLLDLGEDTLEEY